MVLTELFVFLLFVQESFEVNPSMKTNLMVQHFGKNNFATRNCFNRRFPIKSWQQIGCQSCGLPSICSRRIYFERSKYIERWSISLQERPRIFIWKRVAPVLHWKEGHSIVQGIQRSWILCSRPTKVSNYLIMPKIIFINFLLMTFGSQDFWDSA